MAKVIETTGKTVNDAIAAAVAELGVARDEIEIEVLETPTKKFFGLLGETPAKIRATVKISEAQPVTEPPPESQLEPPAEEIPDAPQETFEPVLEPSPVEEPAESPEADKILDDAEKFLQDVFAAMKIEVAIEVTETEDGYQLNLLGKGLGILIGRRGQALDALQYLMNLAVSRKNLDEKIRLTLDVEDYRHRREDTLIKLARSVAERAIKTRRDVRLEPMNRHERKIIHSELQDNNRVETHSVGEEPYRYIVVTPVLRRGRR